jgi:hypothetical protein
MGLGWPNQFLLSTRTKQLSTAGTAVADRSNECSPTDRHIQLVLYLYAIAKTTFSDLAQAHYKGVWVYRQVGQHEQTVTAIDKRSV